jgi:hypothetical protein
MAEKGGSSNARRKERHDYNDGRLIFGSFEDLEQWDSVGAKRGRRHVLWRSSKMASTTASGIAEGEDDVS